MDRQALLAPDSGPRLGATRARVLRLLSAAGSPLGAREIAGRTGLHPNTARFHLDGLVAAGLAARSPRARPGPGRPVMAYRSLEAGDPSGQRRYRLLAEILAGLVARVMPEPGEAAAEAGRAWGRYLTEQPAPFERLDAGQAIERLTATLEEVGFAPDAPAGGPQPQLGLRQCPFRDVAENHQDIVCQLHLGLMQGALAEMRGPVTADTLEPFTEPSLCIAHFGIRPDGQGPS